MTYEEQQLIDKACEWLNVTFLGIMDGDKTLTLTQSEVAEFIEMFRNAMKEE